MYTNAYQCPWCKKDLKDNEIPLDARREYNNCINFTLATELYLTGWECTECNCRWRYNGDLIREGKEEFKDKYKVEETKDESVVTENTTIKNNLNNNESEEKSDE